MSLQALAEVLPNYCEKDFHLVARQNGKGIEVWSDGSYYHGCFREGVKEGEGVYFWADGSKYTGQW